MPTIYRLDRPIVTRNEVLENFHVPRIPSPGRTFKWRKICFYLEGTQMSAFEITRARYERVLFPEARQKWYAPLVTPQNLQVQN